ncbi:MAG: hypothetical protein KGN77_17040 [Xanthomonadaceae bacterium]|nr:hypothetical protein [Xanthomonadaceae bacterium]
MNWLLETFGYLTQVILLVSYAMETKSRWWTAAFAIGCFLAGVYAMLAHAWPFAASEVFWLVGAWIKFRAQTRMLTKYQRATAIPLYEGSAPDAFGKN